MNPSEQIAVCLDAAAWNAILVMLADHPYRQSASAIAAIQQQCLQHEQRMQSMTPDRQGQNRAFLREDAAA